jgi:outer membrane protein
MRTIVVASICAAAWGGTALGLGGKVAFVAVEKLFERYQKTVDLNAKLQQERKKRIAERKTMVEEINKLKDEADLLRDDAKRKKEAVVDEKLKALYQFEEKVKREAIQKQARLQEEILGEMRSALREIGKREGYDMIFAVTDDDIGYHSAKLDITDRVVKMLNKKYGK